MPLYNTSGQIILTVVSGSSITGLYSPDGNWNIVINNGSSITGLYHPCGALNAVVTNDPSAGYYAPNGSIYVISSIDGYHPTSPGNPIPYVPGGGGQYYAWIFI